MTAEDQIFQFERDFAGTLRCIPMIVRCKLDLCGVKLRLRQWNCFNRAERERLVRRPRPRSIRHTSPRRFPFP